MQADNHPFLTRPNRTLIALSIPILFSLIAEPLTGLVDTAMVQSLGAVPLAALGVGTTVLSLGFWIFNFLGISTQTGVAQALGRDEIEEAARIYGLALTIAFLIGAGVIILGWFLAPFGVLAAGAQPEVVDSAVIYIRLRLLGAPAVIMLMVAFGALRGLQNMVMPMIIALVINALNILFDWMLIFGVGPFPELGIAGAAGASAVAQWVGVIWAIVRVTRDLGMPSSINWGEAGSLFKIGGDLFMRTGLLIAFMFFATRVANRMGVETGAAHQVIRQMWIFAAFMMEAFAETSQSLVGYFVGAKKPQEVMRVARYGSIWGLSVGFVVGIALWAGQSFVAATLVPASALSAFSAAWIAAAVSQPINSLAFITDGVHWGTGDYTYMRNGMFAATLVGGIMLAVIEFSGSTNLLLVWWATVVWIFIRAAWGVVRIWPGVGESPIRRELEASVLK